MDDRDVLQLRVGGALVARASQCAAKVGKDRNAMIVEAITRYLVKGLPASIPTSLIKDASSAKEKFIIRVPPEVKEAVFARAESARVDASEWIRLAICATVARLED